MTIHQATLKPRAVYFLRYTGTEKDRQEIAEWLQGSIYSVEKTTMSNGDGSVTLDIDVFVSKVGESTRYEPLTAGSYLMRVEDGFFIVDEEYFKQNYDETPTSRSGVATSRKDWSLMERAYPSGN